MNMRKIHLFILILLAPIALFGPSAWAGVSRAAHEGTVSPNLVEWQSDFQLEPGTVNMTMVTPLPKEIEFLGAAPPAVPVYDDAGEISAFKLAHSARAVTIYLRQRIDGQQVHLHAPVVESNGVQRLQVKGAKFQPSETLGWSTRVGHGRADSLRHRDVIRFERKFQGPFSTPKVGAWYFIADGQFNDSGGIVGEIHPSGIASPGLAVGALMVFALFVLGCIWGVRALEKGAQSEAVDAYIEREFVEFVRGEGGKQADR